MDTTTRYAIFFIALCMLEEFVFSKSETVMAFRDWLW
jgi:inner membrane protein involved in colicin E2 resistance